MFLSSIIPTSIESIKWQDYRHMKTGMILYYTTDPVSEMPIREIPEELPSTISPDPNYETKTFGFYGCKHAKLRNLFIKNKMGYLFFMTKYTGTIAELADELMVTGYFHVKQTADVQKQHIRYLSEYSCIDEENCIALRGDVVHFVSANDAFIITPEVLKSWNCNSRVTRQTKIVLDEEKTTALLNYLNGKQNIAELYSKETERLWPAMDDDDDDDEEETKEYNGFEEEEDDDDDDDTEEDDDDDDDDEDDDDDFEEEELEDDDDSDEVYDDLEDDDDDDEEEQGNGRKFKK
ncbi:MAG: hypothetical protein JW795_01475 [Chitinivibrionales bacterium]|nr:hypothetical protein [Chitinivibrionales bacterium]